jgi:molybdopterin synthase catalytic subunit
MYPIGVLGPQRATLVERLVTQLTGVAPSSGSGSDLNPERDGGTDHVAVLSFGENGGRTTDETGSTTDGGTLGVPAETDLDRYRAAGATTAHALGDRGWRAAGAGRSARDTLRSLATDCAYCVVTGADAAAFEDLPSMPVVVCGAEDGSAKGDERVGPVIDRASTVEAIDLEDIREPIERSEPIETLDSLVAQAKRSAAAPLSGAIATFTGRVRAHEDDDDAPTEYLEFEKYEGVAGDRMEAIGADLERREGIHEVMLHHRTGRIDYGEDIVFVVVLAGHRGEAFRTVEDGIDRLKAEVPIFKKEVTIDEEFWVHDRP